MPITRRPAIPLTLSAFTLIEVVIGLGIIVAVMLLWSPLLTGVQRFTNQDQYLLHALQADADLQANVRTHRMKLESLKQSGFREKMVINRNFMFLSFIPKMATV